MSAQQRQASMLSNIRDLETCRLFLRQLALADVAAIQRLFPRWDIVQHLSAAVPWPYPPDGALTYVRDVALPAMHDRREWVWTIRLRHTPAELIGLVHLSLRPDDNRGFWLDPDHRGQGLMTEAAAAATDFWFEELEQPVLRVTKAIANTASRHISSRNGMRLIGTSTREYVSGPLPSETWEITRQEWRARPRQRIE